MILDEHSAAVFINGYQKLLLEICGPAGGSVKLLQRLAKGRKKLMSDVSLFWAMRYPVSVIEDNMWMKLL